MFFFIIGNTKKFLGETTISIDRRGFPYEAVLRVYRDFVTFFMIPVIPVGKSYSLYFPSTGEHYEDSMFSKIPKEYLAACKMAGEKF